MVSAVRARRLIRALGNYIGGDVMTVKNEPAFDKAICERLAKDPSSIFISYAWDNEDHKRWVSKLGKSLIKTGHSVVLDQFENFSNPAYLIAYGLSCRNVVIVMSPEFL